MKSAQGPFLKSRSGMSKKSGLKGLPGMYICIYPQYHIPQNESQIFYGLYTICEVLGTEVWGFRQGSTVLLGFGIIMIK